MKTTTVFNLLTTLFVGILFQASFFQSTTLASPLGDLTSSLGLTSRTLVKRYEGTPAGKQGTGGPDDSDYPSDDDIRAAYIAPTGPSVFFSNIGDSTPAYNFAQTKPGGVIMRGAFPKAYMTQNKRSTQWYQDFLDRLSGVYAEKATGDVFFVGRWDGVVDSCRIWAKIEYGTLLANGDVTSITLVDYTNFNNQKPYPGLSTRGLEMLEKRDDDKWCFDWDGDREDPADPDHDPNFGTGYYPGNCGVHVQQWQKNENGVGADYRMDITLYDDQQETVGGVSFADAPGGQGVDVDSELPLVFIATTENVDDDPIQFAYGSQSWDSNSDQCSVGKYDSGKRNMDCGFTC